MSDQAADLLNIRDHLRTGRFGQREVWERQLEEAAARIRQLEAAIAQSCDEQRYEHLQGCERATKAEARIRELTEQPTADAHQ